MIKLSKKSGFTLTELMVVVGIFSLSIAAIFVLLAATRDAADVGEARLQVKEYARIAMEKIVREVRLSQASRVYIDNAINWDALAAEPNPGSVINFQMPVGIYGNISLTPNNELIWGSDSTANYRIAYSLGPQSLLLRSTYLNDDASDAVSSTVGSHIVGLNFRRTNRGSGFIHIEVTSRLPIRFNPGYVEETLRSDIKLRN